MTVVRRAIEVSASCEEVESAWFDTRRWASWVDGFGHLVEVSGAWPSGSGEVVWQSNPYGRGRVVERVASYVVGRGQESDVEDDRTVARQSVSFGPGEGGGCRVALSYDYEVKRARPWTFLVDALFIRRAMGDSLGRTLEGFAREMEGL